MLPDELKTLEAHEAAEQFILVKLDEDPDMLKKLAEIVTANLFLESLIVSLLIE